MGSRPADAEEQAGGKLATDAERAVAFARPIHNQLAPGLIEKLP